MKALVRARALELGFDECRFTSAAPPESARHFLESLARKHHGEMAYLERNASKRVNPQLVLPGARSMICLALNYATPADKPSVPMPESEPHTEKDPTSGPADALRGIVARYARFSDYHDVIGGRLKQLAAFMTEIGGSESKSLWYVDTGPILERDLAQRSGIGFVGKHTHVISRSFGNWLFLCEILTTLEFEPDEPEKNRCGTCSRCIAACPTGAIVAPFQLDARLCISYLTIELKGSIPIELRPKLGNRIFGCDDCLAVCPWNRFAREASLMKEHSRHDLTAPELIDLLGLDEAGFAARFAGTPVSRARRRGLLRNVCVALGNLSRRDALPALQRAASDREPLIAEHARWAIDRICSRST